MINYLKIMAARALVFSVMFIVMMVIICSMLGIVVLCMKSIWWLWSLLAIPFQISIFADIMSRIYDWEIDYEGSLENGRRSI